MGDTVVDDYLRGLYNQAKESKTLESVGLAILMLELRGQQVKSDQVDESVELAELLQELEDIKEKIDEHAETNVTD